MTEDKKKEIIEGVVKEAVDAQIRFDTCAWSTLYGLSTYFKFIPQEMVAASRALGRGGIQRLFLRRTVQRGTGLGSKILSYSGRRFK